MALLDLCHKKFGCLFQVCRLLDFLASLLEHPRAKVLYIFKVVA